MAKSQEKPLEPNDKKAADEVLKAAGINKPEKPIDTEGAAENNGPVGDVNGAVDTKVAPVINRFSVSYSDEYMENLKKEYEQATQEEKDAFVKQVEHVTGLKLVSEANKTQVAGENEPETDVSEHEHSELLKKYGAGYVKTVHVDGMRRKVWKATAWANLGPIGKDGTKHGWRAEVVTPPEVKALQNKNPQ